MVEKYKTARKISHFLLKQKAWYRFDSL